MTREEMLQIKEERGYSFQQLAEYSGVPLGTLQKVMTGITRNPRKATLDAIEKVLSSDNEAFKGKAYVYDNNRSEKIKKICESTPAYGDRITDDIGEYTLDDYYALPDDKRAELIEGFLIFMEAPTTEHQAIIASVWYNIQSYIRQSKGSCKVFPAPIDVQVCRDNRNMFQPDLIVICRQDLLKKKKIYGAPDFVLEVLSPSTRKRDLAWKMKIYLDAGVREYWMIDPISKVLIVYNFMEESFYPHLIPLSGKQGLAIYDGACEVDLDEIAEIIDFHDSLEDE